MSDKAQTTRNKIQGVYTTENEQIVFIDNTLRLIDYQTPADICKIIERIQQINEKHDIKFVLSLSCEKEELPECVAKLM